MYRAQKRKYIKSPLGALEMFAGRVRVGYVRCPKCNEWISLYKDELYQVDFDSDFRTKYGKRCTCGFYDRIELIDWDD